MDALKFHGHRCWASVAGVRIGLAALRALGVKRSGGTQLFGVVEIGEDHGGMCFGNGVQYATGCTFGKGNIIKKPLGKLALTLIEKATNRSVRVTYKPTLQKQIGESAFMRKRGMGIMPDDIPLEEQEELVNLVWDAPESDVLTIGEVKSYEGDWFPEIMGFTPCAACGELTAKAYLRVVGEKQVCIPCSGYER
ncbi:MAG: formylmethanofuran dehydrogenase [Deltaproteobacteria bacterium]|nr:formylmethanofuran dehydrogenase [Deltaproteobacteria bacterium]